MHFCAVANTDYHDVNFASIFFPSDIDDSEVLSICGDFQPQFATIIRFLFEPEGVVSNRVYPRYTVSSTPVIEIMRLKFLDPFLA